VRAARRAFDNGWSQTPGRARAMAGRPGRRTGTQPALAELEVRDNGKPLPEAQWDIGDAQLFPLLRRPGPGTGRAGPATGLPDARFRCRIRHEPIGVAGQIIPGTTRWPPGRSPRPWPPAPRWC
jgi:betaine-aldehyde dehydrogenase